MADSPYVSFLSTVKAISEQVGENMEGFIITWSAKKKNHPAKDKFPNSPDEELLHTWIANGPDQALNPQIMQMVLVLLDRFTNNCRGDVNLAMKILVGEIAKEHVKRERQRKP